MKFVPKGNGWKAFNSNDIHVGVITLFPGNGQFEFWPSVQKPNWNAAELMEVSEILRRCNEGKGPSDD